MGELFDLEQSLRSRQDKLTTQEANILQMCKSKAVRDFTVGVLVGGGLTWAATWRLGTFFRINLSGGAAALYGLSRFGRSLDSCVEDVLSLDGSRMQKELANIIVAKYREDSWRMQLISKHFYPEKVFDDSTPDQPKIRWRYRNFFSDNVAYSQRTHDSDSPSNSQSNSHIDYPSDSHYESHNDVQSDSNDSVSKRTNFETKQVPRNLGIDVMVDPLDCVFGTLATKEEILLPNTSSTSPRNHTRGSKRSHRRRRMRHQEVLLQQV